MGGRKPTNADLPAFATPDPDSIDDVLPAPGVRLRMLIVGVNPGLWTAAVNGPFARPGNRFWPSLHRAGLTAHQIDASLGLSDDDVGRATTRADELSNDELRAGGRRLVERLPQLRPDVVAVAGITAFLVAFDNRKAVLGEQDTAAIPGWPGEVRLWAVPQPSGLNAHENIDSLAAKWQSVWEAATAASDEG